MKSLLTTLFAGICLLSFGQRENEIQVRAGFGWGVFLTESEWSYTINGLTFTENDTDGSATVHVPVELRYEFNPRFNAGIDMKFGSYLYDPNDPSTADNSNAFTTIGLSGEFSAISKEKFRLYVGLNLNTTTLRINDHTDVAGETYLDTQTWRGGGMQANVGFMAFFSKPIGFNFNLGYDSHRFSLKTFERDGQSQDLTGWTGEFTARGVNGTIGLVGRF